MKHKLSFPFIVFLILWTVVSVIFYFFAAFKQWEAVMHVYLIAASLDAAVYLLLQSPAVATAGEQEKERRRKALFTMEKTKREKLSRLLLAIALPMLGAFLLDYLMILWNVSPL